MSYVWYAGFGSNLSGERLSKYLQGGRARGASRSERGARDPSLPTHSDRFIAQHQLYFALESTKWEGGGVAFLTPGPGVDPSAGARCHLHRITQQQFADVFVQENRQPGPIELDVERLEVGSHHDALDTVYGRILMLGLHSNGEPIVTFTSPADLEPNRPSEHYLSVIRTGLRETFEIDERAIADYLDQAINHGHR
jgi:hypothetical protein